MNVAVPAAFALVGACIEIITEALIIARPEWRERDVVDDLRVTALYAELGGESVCLLSYDICELSRGQAARLKHAVSQELDTTPPDRVHVFCSHTHSSSCENDHDMAFLESKSSQAARKARDAAERVQTVEFLRVDTGCKYAINRRTLDGPLGTWCLMQSQGCVDNGEFVDGTAWVRDRMGGYGATPDELAGISGPLPATRKNDPYLDLVLFPKADGGYAAGLVRFTAHAVICSAGYWRPNLGRDYPGQLCDRLGQEFGCPILFLQGPCGDHRPRHRAVGIEERDRIANGLAKELIDRRGALQAFPFDRLLNAAASVPCPLAEDFPLTPADAQEKIDQARERLSALPHGARYLKTRKELAERIAFLNHARLALSGRAYLAPDEIAQREARLDVSCVGFGNVHILSFPGELFSTVSMGLENDAAGPTVVASFADGVTGYLMPPEDRAEGGYERTWALFAPEAVAGLRGAAKEMLPPRPLIAFVER